MDYGPTWSLQKKNYQVRFIFLRSTHQQLGREMWLLFEHYQNNNVGIILLFE